MLPADYNIYRLSPGELKNYLILTGMILFISGYVFYQNAVFSGLMSLCSIFGLPWYRRMLADRRKNELRLEFKDMLYSVASSVTAGRYLPEAIEESYNAVSVIHGENSILAKEIANMVRQMKDANSSDEAVLTDLAIRSNVQELMDFTDVCLTCRKTGGDLGRMMIRAVSLLTQNIEIQKEKEVLMAQKKLESRILAVMPVAVTGFIDLSSNDYLTVMYTTAAGRILMTVAFIGTAFSFLWSMKLTYTEGQVSV